MTKFKKIAAAVALAGASIGASAQIAVPWGNHDPAELGGALLFGTGSNFPIDYVYTFSLSSLSDLLAVGVTNDAPGVFDINGAAAKLYISNGNADFNDDALVGGFAFDSTSVVHTFSSLAAGNYFYRVTGQVEGPFGGSYLLSSNLVPVPEPETYALMLAGLGAISMLMRRRKA